MSRRPAAKHHPFTFDRVRGQNRAIGLLRDAVRRDRVAQAYLFHGPWGVGKTTSAMALAAALNCEADPAARPCGRCLPCRKTASFNHPDVRVVIPLYPAALWKEEAERGTPEEPGESALCRLYGQWAADPHHVFRWPKPPSIATEWILEIKRETSRKTFEGRTQVTVLSGVETMGVEAANRILKMLEEPNPSTVFVLTTSRLNQVLPTIRSRCQRVAFGEVPSDEIVSILVDHFAASRADAEQLAAIAGGSPARAISLLGEDVLETRAWALDLARLDRDALISKLATDVLAESRAWNAPRVRQVAEVLMTWYRDVLAIMHGLPETRLINRDRMDALTEDARRLDVAAVRDRVSALEELVQAVEHQVTPSAALFAALVDVRAGAAGRA
jgi:DNA polymerase-3 subunit delta'